MKFSGSVSGSSAVASALQQVSDNSVKAFVSAITDSALLIHETAIKSIQTQSAGKTYSNQFRIINGHPVPINLPHPGGPHTASKPGDAPNTDTGTLVKSIGFNVSESDLSATVGTNLQYAAYLEFGTKWFAPRPWLLPALRSAQDKIKDIFKSIKITVSSTRAAG